MHNQKHKYGLGCLIFVMIFFSIQLLAENSSQVSPLVAPTAATSTPIQYYIRIVSPEPEETFQNSTQNLTVTVQVSPNLAAQDKVQIYVDGLSSGEPQHELNITLPWLPRGSHSLQAKVIQQDGPGAESDIITIYQQRTSINLRAN